MITTGTPPLIRLDRSPAPSASWPAIVTLLAEAGPDTALTAAGLDDRVQRKLAALAADGEFTGAAGQVLLLHADTESAIQRILFVGLGPRSGLTVDGLRRASATATRRLLDAGIGTWALRVPIVPDQAALDAASLAQALAEGVLLAGYRFTAYTTGATAGRPPCRVDTVTLWAPDAPPVDGDLTGAVPGDTGTALARGLQRGTLVGEAVWLARDLCNHPGNVLTPERFAEAACTVAREAGLQAEVIDVDGLQRLEMGGLLAVGAGSRQPPRLVVLDYCPAGVSPERPLVLIGKTVTFDSGGISLKVALDMEQMKADMTGGAAVLAALRAAARSGLRRRIVALFAVVENMPGGAAMRPGDILRMASGTTVEVLNTDAEGRLILADALCHARRYEPECVIDVATLTGASAIVFGDAFNALFATAPDYARRMQAAGAFSGERLWPMPLDEAYATQLRSDVADLRNVAGQKGAMPIAAAFLQHFAAGMPWLHLDIYNTCWNSTDHPCLPKGATGSGTRVLTQFLLDLEFMTLLP